MGGIGDRGRNERGWTLIEMLIAIAVLAIIATLGLMMYRSGVKSSRVTRAIAEIEAIAMDIDTYYETYNEYPLNLDDIGHGARLDPWDRPYQYLNFSTIKGNGPVRKDQKLVPLNEFYDLYSMGPDGQSKPNLMAKVSHDDVIRANDGEFVGVASKY